MDFKVSTEALSILTARIESDNYLDPVLSLMDSSTVPMISLSMMQLEVGVYERNQCPPEAIVEIDGINFNLPAYLENALKGYTLSSEQDKFILVGKKKKFSSFHKFMQHEFGDGYVSI